jgi:hypothetical protein
MNPRRAAIDALSTSRMASVTAHSSFRILGAVDGSVCFSRSGSAPLACNFEMRKKGFDIAVLMVQGSPARASAKTALGSAEHAANPALPQGKKRLPQA